MQTLSEVNDTLQGQKRTDGLPDDVQTEIAQSKNALKEIDSLRQLDMENAIGKVKSGFSAEGITREEA